MKKFLLGFLFLALATPSMAKQEPASPSIDARYMNLMRFWGFLYGLEEVGTKCIPGKDLEFKAALKASATRIEAYLGDHSPKSKSPLDFVRMETNKALFESQESPCKESEGSSGIEQYMTIRYMGLNSLNGEVDKYIREADAQK